MNKEEMYSFMTANPGFNLATAEGDQPHCRGMFLYKADKDGIVFHTGIMKDVFRQISKNPKVELCFNDFKNGTQLRVMGKLEEITDNKVKDEICDHPSRVFLKPWRASGELSDFYNQFKVYCLKKGKAHAWTMATNFAPKEYVEL